MAWTVEHGELLSRLRQSRGWSQQRLAEKIGYSVAYVGLLERGKKSPSKRVRDKLMTVLLPSEADASKLLGSSEMDADMPDVDPYPNRVHVTHLPLYKEAPKAVQRAFGATFFSNGDRPVSHWVLELESLLEKHKNGALESIPEDAEEWVEPRSDRAP